MGNCIPRIKRWVSSYKFYTGEHAIVLLLAITPLKLPAVARNRYRGKTIGGLRARVPARKGNE